MSDRQKNIEHSMFQYLANHEKSDLGRYNTFSIYTKLYKNRDLLTPEAFIGGKLVRIDELENIVRDWESRGWVTLTDNVSGSYFKLSDQGFVELRRRQAEDGLLELSADDLLEQRWSRLKRLQIDGSNAESVSRMINKSLDAISKAGLSNEQTRQASAYMLAAKELVLAPAPPSEVIWDLIYKAAAIAGLLQIIFPVFSSLF